MKLKRIFTMFVLCMLVLGTTLLMAGCNNGKITIGVLQVATHPALDNAYDGFKKALEDEGFIEGKNIEYNRQNPQGNAANEKAMARTLARKSDLLYGISTSSTRALINSIEDRGKNTPIIFSAVTDPLGSGFVNSLTKPGGNVTGVSDLSDVKAAINLLKEWDNIDKVGILYTAGETNSIYQKNLAVEQIEANGWDAELFTINQITDINSVVRSIPESVDALFIPTDNMVANGIQAVHDAAQNKNLIVVVGDSAMLEVTGIVSLGVDFFDLGYQAGKMAAGILKGETNPRDIPVGSALEFPLIVNQTLANEWGIVIPESLLGKDGVEII